MKKHKFSSAYRKSSAFSKIIYLNTIWQDPFKRNGQCLREKLSCKICYLFCKRVKALMEAFIYWGRTHLSYLSFKLLYYRFQCSTAWALTILIFNSLFSFASSDRNGAPPLPACIFSGTDTLLSGPISAQIWAIDLWAWCLEMIKWWKNIKKA